MSCGQAKYQNAIALFRRPSPVNYCPLGITLLRPVTCNATDSTWRAVLLTSTSALLRMYRLWITEWSVSIFSHQKHFAIRWANGAADSFRYAYLYNRPRRLLLPLFIPLTCPWNSAPGFFLIRLRLTLKTGKSSKVIRRMVRQLAWCWRWWARYADKGYNRKRGLYRRCSWGKRATTLWLKTITMA